VPSSMIIDDDLDVCRLFQHELQQSGFQAEYATSLPAALEVLKTRPMDLILLDLHLGEVNALHEMPTILKNASAARIWVLTAHGSIEVAVEAMRAGAAGFFSKSKDTRAIVNELKAAFFNSRQNSELLAQVTESYGLSGSSAAIQQVRQNIERMKDVDSTVLISGESGTGKELIARALHDVSSRRGEAFAAINCAAIPENLLESELFGHRRGAFTDAKLDRKGHFEVCAKGTLLLDEIGEMPLSLQVKLLRVLQEREVLPVGANQSVKVNTRVLASTNLRLDNEVREGRFREDLYYRLTVLRIDTPPLRERKEDIPILIEHFIQKFAAQFGKNVRIPTQEVLARVVAYDWPGNVRELQNAIERAVVLSTDETMHLEDIFQSPLTPGSDRHLETTSDLTILEEFNRAKEDFERGYLTRLLRATRGNISEAARLSGQHRPHIYRLLGKYGIDPLRFKEPIHPN